MVDSGTMIIRDPKNALAWSFSVPDQCFAWHHSHYTMYINIYFRQRYAAAKQALQEHRWGDMYTHFSAEPRNRSQHGYFPSNFRLGGLLLQMLSLCNSLEHIPRHDSVWLGAAVGVCGIKEIFRSTGFDLDRMLHKPDSYSTYVPPLMGRIPPQWQKINSEIPCCSSSLMSRNHR